MHVYSFIALVPPPIAAVGCSFVVYYISLIYTGFYPPRILSANSPNKPYNIIYNPPYESPWVPCRLFSLPSRMIHGRNPLLLPLENSLGPSCSSSSPIQDAKLPICPWTPRILRLSLTLLFCYTYRFPLLPPLPSMFGYSIGSQEGCLTPRYALIGSFIW